MSLINNYSSSLKVQCIVFLALIFVKGVFADQMPPQSGIISVASEPIAIKTTPTSGLVMNRKALVGQPIYLNDEINTSPTSKAQILLKDQTVFNIGPNSTIVIDKFVYDPQKSDLNVSVKKGAFKFFSGKIANSSEEAMKVSLPNATIAVRGTGVAGSVEPNGSATVILLHGAVDITSAANNSTSSLTKSGWAVQINPAGIVSAPVKLPAEVSKSIIQTSKSNQTSTQTVSSSSSAPVQSNTNPPASASTQSSQAISSTAVSSTSVTATTSSSANTAAPLVSEAVGNPTATATPAAISANTNVVAPQATEAVNIPTATNSIVSTSIPITSSTVQSSIGNNSSTVNNTSTALAGANSTRYSTAEATNNLGLGNAQLTPANTYLSSSQSQASSAITQASNASAQSNLASTYATTAANQATIAANAVTGSAPELAIRANELASAAATSASSASMLASNYSTQTSTSANSASQNAILSSQAATTAIGYANTASTQANLVLNGSGASQDSKNTAASIVNQANVLSVQANNALISSSSTYSAAINALSSAQSAANEAAISALAAATSSLTAYVSAQSVAESLINRNAYYEAIYPNNMTSGELGPLGSVTFSAVNVPMSCYNCSGTGTIISQSFVINFLNATATNNYIINFSNFGGKSGTITGSEVATAIGFDGPDMYLPMSNQKSTTTGVYATTYINLYSVGIPNVTKRANVAQLNTILVPSAGSYNLQASKVILGK